MNVIAFILAFALQVIPAGEAFLKPLQPRDSALIADQFEYGFELDGVTDGTSLALQDFGKLFDGDTLALVRGWQLDTLKTRKKEGLRDIRASIVIAPFEAGTYDLPYLYALRTGADGKSDTLEFSNAQLEVFAMPVDTATFEIKPLKEQVKYPLTLKEILPWAGGAAALCALVALLIWWLRRRAQRHIAGNVQKDPAYIVALRELEKFRGEKYLAPERQKQYYSGVTDALKIYMNDRYGIDAPEMTSAELLASLKTEKSLTPELYGELGNLLETSDFVKFAKHVVEKEEAVKALPFAIRFVMDTYQVEEEAQRQN